MCTKPQVTPGRLDGLYGKPRGRSCGTSWRRGLCHVAQPRANRRVARAGSSGDLPRNEKDRVPSPVLQIHRRPPAPP